MTPRMKIRLRFAKHGRLRWIGHHDVLRCLERLLRRARIPIAQTQGFNPRPKLSFALALALGIEGRREVVDFDLEHPVEPEELLRILNQDSPVGLDWLEAVVLAPSTPPPEAIEAHYSLPITPERAPTARSALTEFLSAKTWSHTRNRPGHERTFDLRNRVVQGGLDDSGLLRFVLKVERDGSARPEELVLALGLDDLIASGGFLTRDDVVLRDRSVVAGPAPDRLAAIADPDPRDRPLTTEPRGVQDEAGLELAQTVFLGHST